MTFYEKGMKKGRKKSNKKYKDLPATEKIRLKAERRHLKMVQMLYSILLRKAPFPYWFITLSYDRDIADQLPAEAIRNDIETFGARIRHHLPDGWFFYNTEWSPKSGPHIHLLGAATCSKAKMKPLVGKWWGDITGSERDNLSDVKCLRTPKAVRTRRGYLHKPIKQQWEPKIAKLFGKKRSFGIINRKNCQIGKDEAFTVLHKEDNLLFRGLILADMLRDKWVLSPQTERHIVNMINYGAGCHIIRNRKLVKRFLRLMDIKHGRKK